MTLSVIVPVYNSAACLKKCLEALAQSQYDDFEALVVDDGSDEPVESLVESFGFKYLRIDGPGGPARARNHGAERVNGNYLVFVDADVCVHPDALARFAGAFAADPQITAVIGSYDDSPAEKNFLSQYKNLFHHYVHHASDGDVPTFWSGCGAIRRDQFLAFGGFDERRYRRPAIEDIELGVWMSAAGHRIKLDSRIRGKHLKRWTLWGLCKTDIFDRGVPWTRLMLRAGAMPNTLNLKPAQRLSATLVGLTILATLAAPLWPAMLIAAAAFALAVTALNFDFYRFFAERSGFWFALRVAPLHWLYFCYCGFSVVWGTLSHYLEVVGSGRRDDGAKDNPQSATTKGRNPQSAILTLLCLAAPLVILALAYAWMAVDHGALWLWDVKVHESGRYTLRETIFYFDHFLREIPVDVGMSLFILAGFMNSNEGAANKSPNLLLDRGTVARWAWLLLAATGLVAAAFAVAGSQQGWASAALDLLQFRTRDYLSEYGSHWRYHWLSTLWFGVVAMLGARLIGWRGWRMEDRGSKIEDRRSRIEDRVITPKAILDPRSSILYPRCWLWAWGYFAALTAIFGLSGAIFTDVRYTGHQAREIMTHGPITYLLAFGALRLLAARFSVQSDNPMVKAGIELRPAVYFQAALALLIPAYLAAVTLSGDVLAAGQAERGLAAMVGAHFFEHVLDYLLVILLAAGGFAWLTARQLERRISR